MRIVSLELGDIRRFSQPIRLDGFGPGLNVLSAPNEFGKSTVFDAIHALFFQRHRSTTREVRALRPHAGGRPTVIAEIETDGAIYRIVKSWLQSPQAEVWQGDRLIAKADAAEDWITRLTGTTADGGPAGLIWVRQGQTTLEADTPAETRNTMTARRDLLSSVTGAVDDLTGGRRMDRALARCRSELAELVTDTARPRAGGLLDAAIRRHDALVARQAELAQMLAALDTTLAARERSRKALADLRAPDAVEERARRLVAAQQAVQVAQGHAAQLDRALDRLQLAQLKRDGLAERLTAQAAAATADAAARLRLAEADALATDLGRAQADEQARATECAGAEAAARQAHAAAALLLTDRLRADARQGDAARRSELVARLADAAVALADKTAADRALAALPAADLLADVVACAQALDLQHALRDRGAAHLRIAYAQGAAGQITVGGESLPAGRPVPVVAEMVLDLPGLGQLHLAPAGGADAGRAVAVAADALAAAMRRAGLPDAAGAVAALARRQTLAAAAREAAARLSILAPGGVAVLEAALGALPPPPEPALQPGADVASGEQYREQAPERDGSGPDRNMLQQSHDATGQELERSVAALRIAETRAAAAREAVARAEVALAHARDSAAAAATAQVAARADGASVLLHMAAADAELAQAQAAHQALHSAAPDLAGAIAGLRRAESVQRQAQDDIVALSTECAGMDARVEQLGREGVGTEHAEVTEALDEARVRQTALRNEVEVLRTLAEALTAARDAARDRYFAPVLAELRPLLRLLWPGAELQFDDENLLPSALIRDGRTEAIGTLSGGTREQLALLVRLAFARLLRRSGRPVPLILDDALVFADDTRIERMFDALHAQADDMQIIVLSCRERTFRALGGQKLRLTHMP